MTQTNKCQHDGEMKTGWDEVTCRKCGWILPSGQRIGIYDGWFPSHGAHKEFKKYRTYTGMNEVYPIDATKSDEVQNMTQTNNEREAFKDFVISRGHLDRVNDYTAGVDDTEEIIVTLKKLCDDYLISQNGQQEAVTNLWEALGKWSAYLASNGEQANLAPPSWLIDAVSSATSPHKQIPDGWKLLSDELPISGIRVLIFTDGVEFNGEQYFDVSSDSLNEYFYESRHDMPEVCIHATHWMPLPAATLKEKG